MVCNSGRSVEDVIKRPTEDIVKKPTKDVIQRSTEDIMHDNISSNLLSLRQSSKEYSHHFKVINQLVLEYRNGDIGSQLEKIDPKYESYVDTVLDLTSSIVPGGISSSIEKINKVVFIGKKLAEMSVFIDDFNSHIENIELLHKQYIKNNEASILSKINTSLKEIDIKLSGIKSEVDYYHSFLVDAETAVEFLNEMKNSVSKQYNIFKRQLFREDSSNNEEQNEIWLSEIGSYKEKIDDINAVIYNDLKSISSTISYISVMEGVQRTRSSSSRLSYRVIKLQ